MLTQAHSQETGRERPSSIQNEPRRLKRIKALHWQTTARGNFDLQRLSGALANPMHWQTPFATSFESHPPIGLSSAQSTPWLTFSSLAL